MKLKAGKVLLSNPFLKDPNFIRTVVVLCEYDKTGTLGFVLNKLYNKTLNDLLELKTDLVYTVYNGGPVATDTLFFLHQRPDIISEGQHITDNIYWGGNYEETIANINAGNILPNDIKFCIGYSGWGAGQLEFEMDEKSWIITNATNAVVFNNKIITLWKDVLVSMGGEYKLISSFPLDPQSN
ncbi:MAG: YqgE/AlgH family protein [Bacteroidetes bacterium]|jgi:putative transcriptional regulator|nr:YqgE/AlgH family protein [Bacteroidota bacterium]